MELVLNNLLGYFIYKNIREIRTHCLSAISSDFSIVVDDNRLELLTLRTSSGCSTS